MTTIRDVGKTIGSSIFSQNAMKSKIQKRGVTTTYFLFHTYVIRTLLYYFNIYERDIGDYYIVGHSTNSKVGDYKVGSPSGGFSKIKSDYVKHGLTVAYRKEIAKWFDSDTFNSLNYVGIGDDNTVYDTTQTALQNQSGVRKIADTRTEESDYFAEYDFRLIDRNDSGIVEWGIFDALTGGNMGVRVVTSSVDLAVDKEYKVVFTILVTDATPGNATMTDYGRLELIDALIGNSADVPDVMAWADSASGISDNLTSLGGTEKRNAVKSYTDSRPTNPGYKYNTLGVLTTAQLNSQTIKLSGLYTASTGNNLCFVSSFHDISKTSLFNIQHKMSITIR